MGEDLISNERKMVYIIILNWNGWKDTVECLESIFRLEYDLYKVIVCDNASTDGSIEKIWQWVSGTLHASTSVHAHLRHITTSLNRRAIQCVEIEGQLLDSCDEMNQANLILIQTGSNKGFSAGNNIGIRWALSQRDCANVWLINNDTIVEPTALTFAMQSMQANSLMGICGSTHLYYYDPEKVQALGGFSYNKWIGKAYQIGNLENYACLHVDERKITQQLFGVQGSAMLMSREFFMKVGLLAEEYFLYFEEQDIAVRARQHGYTIGYASKSIIYHKDGSSTGGSGRDYKQTSLLSDYYGIRSRVVFTKKFFPWLLPFVFLGLLATCINRVKRGQSERIFMVFRAALSAIKIKTS